MNINNLNNLNSLEVIGNVDVIERMIQNDPNVAHVDMVIERREARELEILNDGPQNNLRAENIQNRVTQEILMVIQRIEAQQLEIFNDRLPNDIRREEAEAQLLVESLNDRIPNDRREAEAEHRAMEEGDMGRRFEGRDITHLLNNSQFQAISNRRVPYQEVVFAAASGPITQIIERALIATEAATQNELPHQLGRS